MLEPMIVARYQSCTSPDSADADSPSFPVDVGAVQADPLLGPQACADCEDGDRGIAGIKLVGDGVDLLPRLERSDLAALVPVSPWVLDPVGRVPLDEAAVQRPT
jgi:hypothetical protein